MVLPRDAEQKRAIEAFMKALKINYLRKKPTLEELEARLSPKQMAVWVGLQTAIQEVKEGKVYGGTLEELLNEIDHENNSIASVR